MNNLANTNPHKALTENTHHPRMSAGSTLPYKKQSVCGSWVLDCTTLPIVVSLDPQALSSTLEWAHLLQGL